jgi:hypothetical protein
MQVWRRCVTWIEVVIVFLLYGGLPMEIAGKRCFISRKLEILLSFRVVLAVFPSNKYFLCFACLQVTGDGVVLILATCPGFLHGLLDCWIGLIHISGKLLTMGPRDVLSSGLLSALDCPSLPKESNISVRLPSPAHLSSP